MQRERREKMRNRSTEDDQRVRKREKDRLRWKIIQAPGAWGSRRGGEGRGRALTVAPAIHCVSGTDGDVVEEAEAV